MGGKGGDGWRGWVEKEGGKVGLRGWVERASGERGWVEKGVDG